MSEAMNLQSLPTWDLSDLYPAPDSAALQADLAEADKAAREFKDRHTGKLAASPGSELAAAITEYERIEEILGRIMSYAQLLFSSDSMKRRVWSVLSDNERTGDRDQQSPDILYARNQPG